MVSLFGISSIFSSHGLVLGILFAASAISSAQEVGITCYGVSGFAYFNNTKCPGSNACCGVGATCLSNRLCHNPGDGPDTFVRGPCATNPYDRNTCAEICLYSKYLCPGLSSSSFAVRVSGEIFRDDLKRQASLPNANPCEDESTIDNNFLPRVSQCSDGSWCCNNDPQCCGTGGGTFLDEFGNIASAPASTILSYPPGVTTITTAASSLAAAPLLSTTSASTSVSSSLGAAASTTSSSAGAATTVVVEQAVDSTSLKVGLSLGIPLAAIAASLGVWFYSWRGRKRRLAAANVVHEIDAGYDGKLISRPQSITKSPQELWTKPWMQEMVGPVPLNDVRTNAALANSVRYELG